MVWVYHYVDYGGYYVRKMLSEYLDSYDDDKWVKDPNEILSVNFMCKHG